MRLTCASSGVFTIHADLQSAGHRVPKSVKVWTASLCLRLLTGVPDVFDYSYVIHADDIFREVASLLRHMQLR